MPKDNPWLDEESFPKPNNRLAILVLIIIIGLG